MLKYKNEPVSRTEFATRVINRVINDITKLSQVMAHLHNLT